MAIFHPDHDQLHGFTVCITTVQGDIYVGRWDHEEAGEIFLNDGNFYQHDPNTPDGAQEFMKQNALWGVDPKHTRLTLSRTQVKEVRKLGEVAQELRGW